MNNHQIFIAYWTIARKESGRFLRIWKQTLLPSVVTTGLYYVIFGTFIGSQIAAIGGYSYMQFIVPGLVMMAVITNAFSNVVSSFFGSKFQRDIDELLVSPTPNWVIIAGYVTGGVLRGIVVGALVLGVALFFTKLTVHSWAIVIGFLLLTAIVFSLAGLFNAAFAKKFDDTMIVPTFVLTPLTYLGGVFYSIHALPPFWQTVSQANPILYMVSGFRYGFLGLSDVSVWASFSLLAALCIILLFANIFIFTKGYGLKN
ncbi:MAG: ABC transporter permease [Candidatus Moranbacteria bacterium]|nr:ABC transporter permease [Candidatus Moranbacteria bacterium]